MTIRRPDVYSWSDRGLGEGILGGMDNRSSSADASSTHEELERRVHLLISEALNYDDRDMPLVWLTFTTFNWCCL